MAVIHISEAEAARDFTRLMERVRAGEEVVIESGEKAVAVLKAADKDPSIEATLERMRASSKRLGYTPVMDAEFASDMEEIIRKRRPADRSAWD